MGWSLKDFVFKYGFWIVFSLLLVSLAINVYCCVRRKCRRRKRKSSSSVEMKENPIYGNVVYLKTEEEEMMDAQHSHSSLRTQHRHNSDVRDCYAKLSLKAPRENPGGSSSENILYSDVMHLDESRRQAEENTDTTQGDLYATVSTQRFQSNMMVAESEDNYANHV